MYLLVFSAADDIPHADEVRTLIKDIWDLRIAKLRKSIDIMVSQQEVYARVSLIYTGYITCSSGVSLTFYMVEPAPQPVSLFGAQPLKPLLSYFIKTISE